MFHLPAVGTLVIELRNIGVELTAWQATKLLENEGADVFRFKGEVKVVGFGDGVGVYVARLKGEPGSVVKMFDDLNDASRWANDTCARLLKAANAALKEVERSNAPKSKCEHCAMGAVRSVNDPNSVSSWFDEEMTKLGLSLDTPGLKFRDLFKKHGMQLVSRLQQMYDECGWKEVLLLDTSSNKIVKITWGLWGNTTRHPSGVFISTNLMNAYNRKLESLVARLLAAERY